MGFLDICKGNEILNYGMKKGTRCNYVNNNDAANIYTDGSLNLMMGQGGYVFYSLGFGIKIENPYPYFQHKINVLRLS